MAARLNLRQQEQTRSAIQTSQLVNRLQAFALAAPDVEIDAGRLKAIEVLLRKTLPDLSAITLGGDEDNPVHLKVQQDAERFTRTVAGLAARSGTAGSTSATDERDES